MGGGAREAVSFVGWVERSDTHRPHHGCKG
jgi:hypothetical protein